MGLRPREADVDGLGPARRNGEVDRPDDEVAQRMQRPVVTIDDVRAVVRALPRSYEVLVRDRVKFRVGRIVYLAFSRDENIMGFAYPKERARRLGLRAPQVPDAASLGPALQLGTGSARSHRRS